MTPSALPLLPEGMTLRTLVSNPDPRGAFVEIYRAAWPDSPQLVQWNVVRSEARVLRGFHVHVDHADYLLMAQGRMILGVRDIRAESPTCGMTALLDLTAEPPMAAQIPPGVAHGFCFLDSAIHIYAVTKYWDRAGELGCHWTDPAIGIDWPLLDPIVSARDAEAGSLAAMVAAYEAARRRLGLDDTAPPPDLR